tara:strand:+ start:494 stop:1141 length:648 start_codon:yes stop_codon:yes gene_type:complete
MKKSFIKKYLSHHDTPIEAALQIMECRAQEILKRNNGYKDLYIDSEVDIVNSDPQVIQQVKKELEDFLALLDKHKVKNLVQIGLGHWASTHFVLSLLLENITTIEYDFNHIQRYLPESCGDCETILRGDSLRLHSEIEDESFDAVFIDGNHSYEYVKKDLGNYSKKVKKGGIIAMHDANFEGDQYGTPQVIRESASEWSFISHSKEVGIAYTIKE